MSPRALDRHHFLSILVPCLTVATVACNGGDARREAQGTHAGAAEARSVTASSPAAQGTELHGVPAPASAGAASEAPAGVGLGAAAPAGAASDGPQLGERGAAPTAASTQTAAGPAPAGLRVFKDPVTGELTDTPGPIDREKLQAEAVSRMENQLSTSSKGLVEVPSPVEGGGVMVDLKGRFQSASVATTVDGVTTVGCQGSVPGSGTKGQ